MQASLCNSRSLQTVLDTPTLLLPRPHTRPFWRQSGHRLAHNVSAAHADRQDSYVLVDPVPPSALDEAPAGGKATLLGCVRLVQATVIACQAAQ
jgi:hypothetical protein